MSTEPSKVLAEVLWAAVRGALVVAVLLLAVAVKVIPWVAGGESLVILTGSMEPTLDPGDVVAVRPVVVSSNAAGGLFGVPAVAASSVRIGDIVTFQPVSDDPTLVTHRVVSKGFGPDGLTFTTRGDDNNASDAPIVAAQVKGLYLYRVPAVGYVFNLLGGVGSGAVGLLAVLLIGYGLYAVFAPPRTKPEAAAAAGPAGSTRSVELAEQRVAFGQAASAEERVPAGEVAIDPDRAHGVLAGALPRRAILDDEVPPDR